VKQQCIIVMPEGPIIAIFKERLKALHVEGKAITKVTGITEIASQKLLHAKLIEIKSWGKHLLLCFEQFTIRIHLKMSGAYTINRLPNGSEDISLTFDSQIVNIYSASLVYITRNLEEIYDWSADIMSPSWNPEAALRKLIKKPATFICDAILDQSVFAGAGNIIKNEALFRSKVHPLSRIGAVPKPKLREIIDEVRNYSFDFYRWKKERTLIQRWLAYSKETCPRCHIPMVKMETGKTKRLDYFCVSCQCLYKVAQSELEF